MRIRTIFLVGIISSLTLLTACEGGRTFNANVVGIDQVNIEGVKAFASLSSSSSARAGVAGGNNETLLYAVDEYNNITLPDISCNFVFGDEITEKERQDIIDNMNAVIRTEAMYDLGPYVLIKYIFSYTSSFIESEATAAVGYMYGAIRKSDGKVFHITTSGNQGMMWVAEILENGQLLTQYLTGSNAKTYLVYNNDYAPLYILTEEGDNITLSTPLSHSQLNVMTDNVGVVYIYNGSEIAVCNTDDTLSPIDGDYWGAGAANNQMYAFSAKDNTMKVYQISNQKRQLIAETTAESNIPIGHSTYLGCINGDMLFYGYEYLIKYNIANREFSYQPISQDIKDCLKTYSAQFIGQYAYFVNIKGNSAELVKINMLNESKEVSAINLPKDKTPNGSYSFSGSLASDYLRVIIWYDDGTRFTHNVYGEDDLPDFSGYIVHDVIPLQQ